MWGNLALESQEQKEVAVPFLKPGQVGMVSVSFVAPMLEGTYTSHWRLAHCGVQFGPRVWCSIVVIPNSGQKPNSHSSKIFVSIIFFLINIIKNYSGIQSFYLLHLLFF